MSDEVPEVVDLDILRPRRQFVRLNGKKIDISIIPCGITFEIDKIVRSLIALDQAKVDKGGKETETAVDLTIRLCATFARVTEPEMDEAWFRQNVSAQQLRQMADIIKDALLRSYEGVKEYGKK